MHAMLFTLVMVAVLVATALLFVFWVVVTVMRGVARLILGPGLKRPEALPALRSDPPHTRRCGRESCKAINPDEARFCRRCGQRLDDPHRVAVRRVAMF